MSKLQPETSAELQQIVKEHRPVLPVGGNTKPALSTAPNGATHLEMSKISGIIEYEPGEYTFTAYAGTPVSEVQTELEKHGQYLPFDPLLVAAGATLGGVVAANTAGSGRYRYGGLRDFILGVHFVDGQGQLVRSGGKVVKNSAGFDLPKFMVGSLGRFGVFVNLTFKVFPKPENYVTLKTVYPGLGSVLEAVYLLSSSSYDMDALDLEPLPNGEWQLLVRLGGLSDALPGRSERLVGFLQAKSEISASEVIVDEAETELWQAVNRFDWLPPESQLVKVPVSPKRIPLLENVLQPDPPPRRYAAGGNIGWMTTTDTNQLDSLLCKLELPGLVLFGSPEQPLIGARQGLVLARRVKQALDPNGTFLPV
jgi:glycolate oxidase FAD binding subunit